MRRFVIVLVLCVFSAAYSQTPPLSKGKSAQVQPHTGESAAPQTAPTEPLVTLAQVRALLLQEEAKQKKQEGLAESSIDWWGRLTNLLLVLVGAGQIWLLKRTNDLTKQSADAATDSARLTKQAFESSEASGKENLALTRQVADAAAKSAELSLGLYERPWVMLLEPQIQYRNVSPPPEMGGMGGITASPVYPRVRNDGRSPAFMGAVGATIIEADALPPAESTVKTLLENLSPAVLAPGSEHNLLPLRLEYESGQGTGLFVVVAAEYTDLLGKVHRSVSVWGFDSGSFRFLPLKAPEYYEYT